MPWFIGGAALLGAGASLFGSSSAANAQSKAAAKQLALQKQMYDQTRTDLAPYRDEGQAASSRYSDLIGLNGPDAQSAAYANFRTDPGYDFAVSEGLKATNYGASPGYSFNSGGRLKALQTRGQGLADQQYSSYLDRYNNVAQRGQAAAAGQAAANQNYATAGSQAYGDAGAAQAGGYVAGADAATGAISNALKLYGYKSGWGAPSAPASSSTYYGSSRG